MKSVRLLAQARQEIRDAAEYYETRAAGLGVDFTTRLDSAVLDIRENPEGWPFVLKNIRRRMVSRFPYGLLYRVDAEEIVVSAVMHLRRHPSYWQGRK